MSFSKSSKTAKPSTRKKKSQSPANTFLLLRDLKPGEAVRGQPSVFEGDFRFARQVACRTIRRHGVLREGRLQVYTNQENARKNRLWRAVDLARCNISYRLKDRKILLTTTERYRLQVKKEEFEKWVEAFRAHRLYAQWKLANGGPAVRPTTAITEFREPVADSPRNEKISESVEVEKKDKQQRLSVSSPSVSEKSLRSPKVSIKPTAVPAEVVQKQLATLPVQLSEQKKAPANVKVNVFVKDPIVIPVVPKSPSSPKSPAVTSSPSPSPAASPVPAPTPSSSPMTPEAVEDATPVLDPKDDFCDDRRSHDSADSGEKQTDSTEAASKTPSAYPYTNLTARPLAPMRTKLPAVMAPQPSLFRLIMSALGRNIMRMALPAAVMEPLSTLQIVCEEMEYSDLLDAALTQTDPQLRMIYVAAYAMSRYGSTALRAGRKPFNPLLGETFDYSNSALGWRFLAEQVSHHPAISAAYAEGRGWRMWQDCELIASLSASAVKATPIGSVFVRLEKYKETYQWNKVVSVVSGILTGKYTMDHIGDMIIVCKKTKLTGKLTFKKMVSGRRGDMVGQVVDKQNRMVGQMYGNWTESFYVGGPDSSNPECIWRVAAMPIDHEKYFGFPQFALGLNELRPDVHGALPPTDTRYRPDQRALETGNLTGADKLKKELEEHQRQRRKANEAQKIHHVPNWFKPTSNTKPTAARWQFNGKYWHAKKENFKDVEFIDLW